VAAAPPQAESPRLDDNLGEMGSQVCGKLQTRTQMFIPLGFAPNWQLFSQHYSYNRSSPNDLFPNHSLAEPFWGRIVPG
jgi:hypothetical protein